MKKSRYSDSQLLAILKQSEAGTPVPEFCREHGMSSARLYKWRDKYGRMEAIDDGPTEGAGSGEPAFEEDVCRRAAESRDCSRRPLAKRW